MLALGATACSSVLSGGAGTATPVPDPPAGQIVFQARSAGGGLTPIEFYLGNRPDVTIYGDGTAYVLRDEQGRGYPGRPLAFVRGAVAPDVLASLIRDAQRSGLFDGADFGLAQVLDAGGVSVRFRPGAAGAHRVDVYALDIAEADKRLSLWQQANRVALRKFIERLERSVVLGDAQVPQAWVPDRVDVTEPSTGEISDTTDNAPTTPWPGPPLDGLLRRTGTRPPCGVLSGADARPVYAAARKHGTANWKFSDGRRVLVIRALLPGEPGCA